MPAIKELATGLVGQSSACPALLRSIYVAHASCASVREGLRARLRASCRLMTEIFALAQKRGEIRRDIQASELARLTQFVFHGVAMAWAMNPDSSLCKTAEEVWELFCPNLYTQDARRSHKPSSAGAGDLKKPFPYHPQRSQ